MSKRLENYLITPQIVFAASKLQVEEKDHLFSILESIVETFRENTSKRNINSAIELYNLHLTLSVGRKATDVEGCDTVSKDLLSRTAVYFSGINESNIVTEYQNVGREYLHDFWTLFEKFNVYKRVSDQIFSSLMNDDEHNLSLILENKKVVSHYDNAIGEFIYAMLSTGFSRSILRMNSALKVLS